LLPRFDDVFLVLPSICARRQSAPHPHRNQMTDARAHIAGMSVSGRKTFSSRMHTIPSWRQ